MNSKNNFFDDNSFVREVILNRNKIKDFSKYPYNIPAIKELHEISLHPSITFIVGENGAGKSTLIEAIAVAYGFNAEGGSLNFNFSTRPTHSELYKYIILRKGIKKARDGYFLRAESFYNLATNIDEMDEVPSFGGPLKNSYGGMSLHEMSHGESFMALLMNRLGGNGFYIFDEPEAAMSPFRQMMMLARIHELVKKDSQFIISTHSPILMAYPDSIIYKIDDNGIYKVNYEETEHYMITKQFMNNREVMLNELLK